MKLVLLSGGSGKRLWPLSNELRSKQFLRLLKGPDGQPESMVQRVYRQMGEAGIKDDIVISTSAAQVESIVAQLGSDVDIVIEPERRDTFPAIALACGYLYCTKQVSVDETIAVFPVDPFADLEYFQTLYAMDCAIQSGETVLALMGIHPTYPSEKYGYILPGLEAGKARSVVGFREKPSKQAAIELIERGAFWNGGVFAFKLGYLLDIVRQSVNFNDYNSLLEQYMLLPKISFDYEVVEKASGVGMVEYNGVWKDLGTWNTLTEVMDTFSVGNVIMADSCVNTHIINELDIPIISMGTKDLVIAASPDGILVSEKSESSYLKPHADQIEQRPMYVEHHWGEYKIYNYSAYSDGSAVLTKCMRVNAGARFDCEQHPSRKEIWTVLQGTGLLSLENEVRRIEKGSVVCIPSGQAHSLTAVTDLEFIEVQIKEGGCNQ